MRIILLGPPGSGKGTQGDLIEQKYNFPKISTGDLLREEVQENTPLGKRAEAAMNRGDLVSDEIVMQMVEARLSREDCQKGYILDGFPRNINQAKLLEGIPTQLAEVVLDIRMSEKKLIERLSSRRICSQCGNIYNIAVKAPAQPSVCDACRAQLVQRQDDMPEVILERLRIYHQETEPLIAYYQKKANYHPIEGDRSVESVFQNIQEMCDEAEEYIWRLTDKHLNLIYPNLQAAADRGIEYLRIEPEVIVESPHVERMPLVEPGEVRGLDMVDVFMAISEKEAAAIAFPEVTGGFDYLGFTSRDEKTLKWCNELFQYYWNRAKPKIY